MMDAIRQYIDLFEAHRQTVDNGSCAPLNALREEALRMLRENLLPEKGSENYETTDLAEMLSPDYGLNIRRVPVDVNPSATFHCGVPNLSTSLFFNVNDLYAEASGARNGLPDGVYIGSIRRFAAEHPDVCGRYYGKCADLTNPVVALDSLLVQDGIAVWVRKGVRVEKPVQLVNILQSGSPLMAVFAEISGVLSISYS